MVLAFLWGASNCGVLRRKHSPCKAFVWLAYCQDCQAGRNETALSVWISTFKAKVLGVCQAGEGSKTGGQRA